MKLLIEPYGFQKEGIDFAYKTRYSINGDKMGLGKTLQAVGLAVKADVKKTLIVCPAFLVPNWKSEIEKFCGETAETMFFGLEKSRFDIVSYGSLKKTEKVFDKYDLVVCDEIHYVKNIKAARSARLHGLVHKHEPDYFLGLSGTPIKNRIPEFYSLLRLCWYGGRYPDFNRFSGSYWLFNERFTKKKIIRFGGRRVTKFEGVKNVAELKALIKPVYIRRKAEDVLDLPEEIDKDVIMADKSKTDKLLQVAWEAYEGNKGSKSFASGKAVSALGKVGYTVEYVTGLLEEVDRVVIFTDHVQAAKKIAAGLPQEDVRFVTGETPVKHRSDYVNDIQSGKIRVLVSTIGSLSVGVNLTAVHHMVFNDFAWVPADIDQARKRIHRIGQKNNCVYHNIFASKYDKIIHKTLLTKRNIIAEVDS